MPQSTVSHHKASVNGVQLFYRAAGTGAPVVLLHGLPQTSHTWRYVIPALAERYTVIAPDLRGVGYSSKPVAGYDKQTLAQDIHALVGHLGFEQVRVVGTDFGATVAYAYAATQRDAVEQLVIMEITLPGTGFDSNMLDFSKGSGAWHFAFHMAPDVPEMLVAGKERAYLTYFFQRAAYNPAAIGPADIDEYVHCYTQPGAMRAYFEYYRTWLSDIAANKESTKSKLTIPVLALVGDHTDNSHVADAVRVVADDVESDIIKDCGHWVSEEQPEVLTKRLLDFFARSEAVHSPNL